MRSRASASKLRVDPATGRKNYIMIQAEDELASIGMVIGASWNGARAFTATSGPGLSLMQEFLGLAYYAEVPAVVFDIQRVGPSTGMPTRTQQGDIHSAAYASHGDTRQVCLYPANPEECFEFAATAFDLAERLQTPVLVLSDLDIGMNDWMCPEFKWDESYRPDRGKVLDAEQLEKIDRFWRYYDHDNDGIPQRTLPGVHPKGAYFTRGSGHNQYGGYTEDSKEYQMVVDRLRKKWMTAARLVPQAGDRPRRRKHDIGDRLARQLRRRGARGARAAARRRASTPTTCACAPFRSARKSSRSCRRTASIFVVEQNRDAQLRSLLITGDRRREDAAALDPALQRHADPGQLRRRRRRRGDRAGAAGRAAGVGMRGATMTFMAKPKVAHPELPKNALGLTRRDYEGANSTLCAGCGHDSITAAIVEACWADALRAARTWSSSRASAARRRPRRTSSAAATASIPCTAACPRSRPAPMPPTASCSTSASPATATRSRSASASSAMRSAATSNMVYVIENNGVYGLTKGQFSASADVGSTRQEGRGQQAAADRSGAARDHARRLVRGAQLLGRQGAAGAAAAGGDASSTASR